MTVYRKLSVPGFDGNADSFTPREPLASTVGYRQFGVTVASGQGIILAGTVLGRNSTTKKYYVYNNAAADGTEVAVGILRESVDTTLGDVQANVITAGAVFNHMVSGADANAITDLGARVIYVDGSTEDLFQF